MFPNSEKRAFDGKDSLRVGRLLMETSPRVINKRTLSVDLLPISRTCQWLWLRDKSKPKIRRRLRRILYLCEKGKIRRFMSKLELRPQRHRVLKQYWSPSSLNKRKPRLSWDQKWSSMKNKEGREHLIVSIDQLGQFCVGICVRKTFQNLLKLAKIGKNKKNENDVVPNTSLTLRRLGSSGVLTANP